MVLMSFNDLGLHIWPTNVNVPICNGWVHREYSDLECKVIVESSNTHRNNDVACHVNFHFVICFISNQRLGSTLKNWPLISTTELILRQKSVLVGIYWTSRGDTLSKSCDCKRYLNEFRSKFVTLTYKAYSVQWVRV